MKSIVILIGVLMTAISSSLGAILVSTDFESGYTVGGLDGQSGSSDVGLSGAWSVYSTVQANYQVVSEGLSYTVNGGGTISGGSQSLRYTYTAGSSSVANTAALRNLTTAVTANEVYVRILMRVDQQSPDPQSDYLFWATTNTGTLGSSSQLNEPGIGSMANQPGAQIRGGTGRVVSGSLDNSVQLLVARMVKGTSNQYETVSFWLNPTFDSFGTPTGTATDVAGDNNSITMLALQQNNMSTGATYTFDNFAIGESWTDIVPVPEPSTLSMILVALGMVQLLGRRAMNRCG